MIILSATNRSIEVVLGDSVDTNELHITASWCDLVTFGPDGDVYITNGTTPVTVVPAPGSGERRQLKELTVVNKDLVANQVIVQFNKNGTIRTIFSAMLDAGDNLQYTDGEGFRVLTSDGEVKGFGPEGDQGIQGIPGNDGADGVDGADGADGTLVDGDYGDVTISGTGTIITIDNGAVDDATLGLTTPALGTPSALVGTNITGTAAGLTAGNATTAVTLTGLTSSVAELNILDGVTATASELNALDGITASVTELNYTDGVTSAIQTQLDLKAPITNAALVTPNLGTPSAGVLTNCTGTAAGLTAGNATLAATVTVADAAGDTTTWPMLATSQTGSLAPATDAGLTYNATTNAITATRFVGNLTGVADYANLSDSQYIDDLSGIGTTYYPALIEGTPPFTSGFNVNYHLIGGASQLSFNPSTSTLTATNFAGKASTVTTNANLTGPITSVGNATSIASQTGTGTKFVVDNGPTLIAPLLGTPASGVLTNCTGTASGLTAGTVTTNANLTGDVTSTGNATAIAAGVIVDADVNASAAIAGSKIATATTTSTGVAEASIASEVTTGTDTARYVSPDSLSHSNYGIRYVQMQLVEGATNVATGDGQGNYRFFVPAALNGFNLVYVDAAHVTAGTTGVSTYQIANVTQAADMLSTKITIDSTEQHSKDAAAAAVIDTGNDDVATGDEIRFDCDGVSTTPPKGLSITLGFQLP